jgi:cytosine/adenosine deaminase-related metal-dependent hydrolase
LKGFSLKNGIIVSFDRKIDIGTVHIKAGKIAAQSIAPSAPLADLAKNSYVYPALINTHDHFRGNYLPRCGPPPGSFYLTWLPWDNDLKASACYAERTKALDVQQAYLLSAYKNLFSGVVSACDHFPHKINKKILPALPIRVIQNYAIAHECSSYELKWGGDLQKEHRAAVKNNAPFITHLSEGFDEESMNALRSLESLGILDNHCLFVHCIGFSDEDIYKTAKAGASISWCAASNMLMFNTTCKIQKFIRDDVNVTIGTDSSHTGMCNMLAEIKYDRQLYRSMSGEDLSPKKIFEMVTINAAKALWIDGITGTLEAGKSADILLLKAKHDDPFENLAQAECKDIELLIYAGKPIFGEARFIDLFGGKLPENYTMIKAADKDMFVVGDPLALYNHIRGAVGYKKILDFLPFEPEGNF